MTLRRIRRVVSEAVREYAADVISDLLLVGGFAALGYGLWGVDPRLTYGVLGVLAMYAGWRMGAEA
jgi:hypothetical protein